MVFFIQERNVQVLWCVWGEVLHGVQLVLDDVWSNCRVRHLKKGFMLFQAITVQLPTFGCKKQSATVVTSQTPQFIDRREWFQEESASADCGRTDGVMGVAGNGCGNIPTATRLTLELNLLPIHSANNQALQFLIPPCRIPIPWHKPLSHSPLPWIEPPSHSLPIPLTHYKSPWLYFAQVQSTQSTYTSLF